MKTKKRQGCFREPSSWLLHELDLIVGFLTFDFDDLYRHDEEEELIVEEKSFATVSPEFVRPLPVVPELIETSDDENDPPRRRKFQDPPEEDTMDSISCRPVVGGRAFSRKDDVDTVGAISPRRVYRTNRVRKMMWAEDEISCATGRVVFVQNRL